MRKRARTQIEMKILVCGSRVWSNIEVIENTLRAYSSDSIVVHGGARGADQIVDAIAKSLGMKTIVYPADWNRYGKSAGMIRNREMLEAEKPDLVLAFWDGESKGTKNMIDVATKAKVSVITVITLKKP